MFRGLPVLIEICLFVYCLIDAIQTPSDEMRNLPKVTWVILIILVPFIGSIAWLVAGKPNSRRQSAWAVRPRIPRVRAPAGSADLRTGRRPGLPRAAAQG